MQAAASEILNIFPGGFIIVPEYGCGSGRREEEAGVKLTQLKYFQVVCRCGNLTRASRELHISQSSLSEAIRELEEEFGVLLFYRLSRGLALTKEGEYFLQEINGLLEHADQVAEHMNALKSTGQTVTLGVPPMISVLLFPRLLALFQKSFPGARLLAEEGGSLVNEARVADGTLDAAVISCSGDSLPELSYQVLCTLKICFFVSRKNPLARKECLRMADIGETPLALLGEDSFLTSCISRHFEAQGLTPNVVLNTNQLAAVGQIVRDGTAAAFLFQGVLPEEDETAVLPVEDLPPVSVCLIWNEARRLPPCAARFIRMVKGAGGSLAAGLSID